MGSLPKPKPLPPGGIKLNIPQGEMDFGLKATFYGLIRTAGEIISSSKGPTDQRFYMITLLIIGLIPRDIEWVDARQKLADCLVDEIALEEQMRGVDKLDNETVAMCKFAACTDAIHEVIAFLDNFEGLTHNLVIGEI